MEKVLATKCAFEFGTEDFQKQDQKYELSSF